MPSLFLCGDVMLARGIDQILAEPCDPKLYEPYMDDARDYIELAEQVSGPIPRGVPPEYPWGDALSLLAEARPDARIINLETSITRRGEPDPSKHIHYRVSPQNAASIAAAAIDVCVLANNHVLDWGQAGLLDTLDTLDRMRIARCGAGRDLDEATRPAVIERGGHRIAVFSVGSADAGVPPWWSAGLDRPGVFAVEELDDDTAHRVRSAIEPWLNGRTIIVLSLHWGPNWGFAITRAHRRFARRMIDEAGVHVVHGHSSHHVKAIEIHQGQPILYGCGDLLTDYEGIRGHEAYRGDLGLMYLVALDARGSLVRLEMIPTRMQRFRITEASPEDAQWLARTLSRSGADLGTWAEVVGRRLQLRW